MISENDLIRRQGRIVILVHNPIGFGSARVKHQHSFLADFLAISTRSLEDIHGFSSFLPEPRSRLSHLSITSVVPLLLPTEEIPNLVFRFHPRLSYEKQRTRKQRGKKKDSNQENHPMIRYSGWESN